jgi:transposase
MQKQVYIGIDVSSATLDICVRQEGRQQSLVISNESKEIRAFLRPYARQVLVIGMENTGRYNWMLYEALAGAKHRVYVIPPLHLKKSMGLARGKNDKVDAIRIASFIEKNHCELKPWVCPAASIQKLKILLTERTFRCKNKRQLLKQQYDYAKMKKLGLDRSLLKMNEQLIAQIEKQINLLEEQIEQIIQQDEFLKQQSSLMRTIPGVGKVLCWMMLAKTEGFTSIDDPRKMACYSGVVPFDYQSGTSVRGKQRVSAYADKSMKSILHLAAMSAIRLKNDLRNYYQRKVAEGKNKMSVLNAVRNKIIHRIFAVIKSQTPYQINLELS